MNLLSRSRARSITSAFRGLRMLVVGDLMLDHWVWGSVSRISPEAPIPVVDVQRYSYTPGGAANVVSNLKALGAEVDLLGVVGADDAGRRLRNLLRRQGAGVEGLFVQKGRPTSLKSRIIAHSQHVVRADLEHRVAVDGELWNRMLDWLEANRDRFSAALLSDYHKGMFWNGRVAQLLERLEGRPVLAGPKPENLDQFRGVEMVTLNALEARLASGHDTATPDGLRAAGQALLDRVGGQAVLVTLGERGMALFERGRAMRQVPALASQVYDVSGAGDTVLSVVGLSRAVGADPEEAMRLASHAAAVVVRKVGTATVEAEELLASLDREAEPAVREPASKVLDARTAAERLARLRAGSSPPRVVFTNGCFDLLHVGHLRTLMTARREGDLLVVGVNSDRSVQALKGPERPLTAERERAELLAGLECVDLVVLFDEDTPLELLDLLRPDVHVKGGDYREDDLPEAPLVRSWGGRVVLTGVVPDRSTTRLAERLHGPS